MRKVRLGGRPPKASRKMRYGWLPARTDQRRGNWPPPSRRVTLLRPRVPAARAPWPHGQGQNRDLWRWHDRTPRARRGTSSASPHSPECRRPARPTRRRTREVRIGLSTRSEEHTSELQSHLNLVCRLLLEKKKSINHINEHRR